MSEEEQDPSEENPEAEGEPIAVQPTEVTRAQWASIFVLIILSVYLYFIWPHWASHQSHLKPAQEYLDIGRQRFSEAHHDKAFPFDLRVNTFQESAWAFSQAQTAEGELSLKDYFEWGTAKFTVAKVTHPGSRYAMVEPIELFEKALDMAETIRIKAMAEGGVEAARLAVDDLVENQVDPAKIRYRLGLAYLEAERVDKAKPLLEYIRNLRLRYDQYQRMRDRKVPGRHLYPPVTLDARPYNLQHGELYEVEWLLGRAYHITEDHRGAITSLEDYLESTRSEDGNESGPSRETRFNALQLLCKIHIDRIHELEGQLRFMKGQLDFSARQKKVQGELKDHLDQVSLRYRELFTPAYTVFGLEEVALSRAEVAYKRGKVDQVLSIASSYSSANPHLRNEMKLWETLALLKKNPNTDVIPTLNVIAGDNTRRRLRLAALVILGDTQVQRGEIDDALGVLLPSNKDILYRPSIGAYERAATQFDESEFDKNRMIDKFTLIEAVKRRAHKAESDGNENDAIRLYKFLLKYFTVPVASIKQGVASLYRKKAEKILAKERLSLTEREEASNRIMVDEKMSLEERQKLSRKILADKKLPKAERKRVAILVLANEKIPFEEREQISQVILNSEKIPLKERKLEASKWFLNSAEAYLETDDTRKVGFEKNASRHALFRAAESYFAGEFYSKAYETYGRFIDDREDDSRVSQARHKRGVSALYRKQNPALPASRSYEHDRFQDARNEFFANISRDLRPIEDNKTLDHTVLLDNEKKNIRKALEKSSSQDISLRDKAIDEKAKAILSAIKKSGNRLSPSANITMIARKKLMDFQVEKELLNNLLSETDTGSRDIWAYHSLLELGKAYFAEHLYEEANQVFDRIKNDRRFSPSSEPWRKAAYAHAQMTYDSVHESMGDLDWNKAILPLQDLLRLYDIQHFDKRFPSTDEKLKATIRRENAKAQVNLATAYLKNEEPDKALTLLDELLTDQERFDIRIPKESTEDQEFCTAQKVQALHGDALFDLKRYENAMESYRKAHDQNLESYERALYSLNIVDCLIGLDRKDDAMERLKRTKWEFDQFFTPDSVVMNDSPAFNVDGWKSMIDFRMAQLQP